jgi:hypothetical protein
MVQEYDRDEFLQQSTHGTGKKIQQRNENEERLAERKPAGTHEPH